MMKFKTTVVIEWESRKDIDADLSSEETANSVGEHVAVSSLKNLNVKRNPKVLHAKTEFAAEIVHVEIDS